MPDQRQYGVRGSPCRIGRARQRGHGIGLGALTLVLVAVVACGGPRLQTDVDADIRAINDHMIAGDYREAERLAADAGNRVSMSLGADSAEFARFEDLLVAALVKGGKGGTAQALSVAEHARRVKEAALGPDHVQTAPTLHNLGLVRLSRGEFTDALMLHTRALEVRRAARVDDERLADSLDLVALTLIRLKRFDEAGRALADALRIREAHERSAPLALAQTLEFIALMHRRSGRFAEAGQPAERSLALRRQHAPGHPDTLGPLQILGDLRFLAGDTAGAQRIWTEARDIGERRLGPDHVAVAELLNRLGMAQASAGNLAQARALREQALRIGERWLAPCHPQSAILVNDLADSFETEGRYAEARRLYRKASATLDDCAKAVGVSPEPDTRATTALNEAAVATKMGDWAEAERLYRTSVDLWSKTLGADHPFVARGLDGLADVASSQGRFDASRRLYEQVLGMRRQTLGLTHPQVAWTLASLAEVTWKAGETATALRFADEAVAVYEQSGAGDDPDRFAQGLELRGLLQASTGRVREGRADLEKALSERSRILGRTHPLVARTRVSIAKVNFADGLVDAALAAALEAEQDGRAHLLFTARYLPERVALAYASRRPRGLDLALSIAATGGAPEVLAVFDSAIRSRSVILDELASRARSAATDDPTVAKLVTAVTAARERFATLMFRSTGGESVSRVLLDEARHQKEEAERALAEQSAEARAENTRASVGFEEMRRALPPETALISFVRYDRTVVGRGGRSRVVPSYVAFIVSPGTSAPHAVPLGTATSIEAAVESWRHELEGPSVLRASSSAGERSYRLAGTRLRQRIWDPVTTHLGSVRTVFIVPDGALNLVSFAAMPTTGNHYLADDGPVIHLVSAERDLVLPEKAPTGRGLLAVGGASYDVGPSLTASSQTLRSGCGTLASLRFEDLPGSRAEVQDIAGLWTPSAPKAEVTVLNGQGASEAAVVRAAAGRRIVHLATHGFFLDSNCKPQLPNTRGVGGLASRELSPSTSDRTENPLLFTGLALAGANRGGAATAGGDDGILTAEEVSGLNLQGTEWAVLSACDTGLGQIQAGEGVFGLRRAFQIAGAATVIMSLWSVEDQSTRLWMRALYDARLRHGASTAEAVQRASASVLQDRRSRGQSTHPFYWAAFVAAGDWR